MIGSLGISNAANLPVQATAVALPQMSATITGWFRPLVLGRTRTVIENFEARQSVEELSCMGVIQPFTGRELELLPEGQRRWNWSMLHVTPDVNLLPGEKFTILGVSYTVMAKKNYADYGYLVYEVVQGYLSDGQPNLEGGARG